MIPKVQPPASTRRNLKRERFARNSNSAMCGGRRESYKIASNARRRNNILQSFLSETCSQCVCEPLFDWPHQEQVYANQRFA